MIKNKKNELWDFGMRDFKWQLVEAGVLWPLMWGVQMFGVSCESARGRPACSTSIPHSGLCWHILFVPDTFWYIFEPSVIRQVLVSLVFAYAVQQGAHYPLWKKLGISSLSTHLFALQCQLPQRTNSARLASRILFLTLSQLKHCEAENNEAQRVKIVKCLM